MALVSDNTDVVCYMLVPSNPVNRNLLRSVVYSMNLTDHRDSVVITFGCIDEDYDYEQSEQGMNRCIDHRDSDGIDHYACLS